MIRQRQSQRRQVKRAERGFTLIEVLVVIVVIGILIAALGLVGSKLLGSQKKQMTRQIIAAADMVVQQYANENPMAARYDRGVNSFGPYPPYQLAAWTNSTIATVLDQEPAQTRPTSFRARLLRDFGGEEIELDKTYRGGSMDGRDLRGDDDIRAFYTYVRVFMPDALAQVPEGAKRSLDSRAQGRGENIDPDYSNPGDEIPILGIVDAWGVPLDYFLYVKLEYTMPRGATAPRWVVTSRTPVFRSRGIDGEQYDAWLEQLLDDPGALPPDTKDTWIFSTEFPAPAFWSESANVWSSGAVPNTGSARINGWARALGEEDPVTNIAGPDPRQDPHAYGFVP